MMPAAAPAPAPMAAPLPQSAAAPIAAPTAVVPTTVPACTPPGVVRPCVVTSVDCTDDCVPSASVIPVNSRPRRCTPFLSLPTSATRPTMFDPRAATTTPSTTRGCASEPVN